jgi:hypothetical protein
VAGEQAFGREVVAYEKSALDGGKLETSAKHSQQKSEGRNPKAQRRSKSEIRIGMEVARVARLRVSAFGFLSGFGLRISGFEGTGISKLVSSPDLAIADA